MAYEAQTRRDGWTGASRAPALPGADSRETPRVMNYGSGGSEGSRWAVTQFRKPGTVSPESWGGWAVG